MLSDFLLHFLLCLCTALLRAVALVPSRFFLPSFAPTPPATILSCRDHPWFQEGLGVPAEPRQLYSIPPRGFLLEDSEKNKSIPVLYPCSLA